jgi:hypothetical protein
VVSQREKGESRSESGQVDEEVTKLKDDDDGREKGLKRDDWRCDKDSGGEGVLVKGVWQGVRGGL